MGGLFVELSDNIVICFVLDNWLVLDRVQRSGLRKKSEWHCSLPFTQTRGKHAATNKQGRTNGWVY